MLGFTIGITMAGVLLAGLRELSQYLRIKDLKLSIGHFQELATTYLELYMDEKKSVENLSNELCAKVLENVELKKDVRNLEILNYEMNIDKDNAEYALVISDQNLAVSHELSKQEKEDKEFTAAVDNVLAKFDEPKDKIVIDKTVEHDVILKKAYAKAEARDW